MTSPPIFTLPRLITFHAGHMAYPLHPPTVPVPTPPGIPVVLSSNNFDSAQFTFKASVIASNDGRSAIDDFSACRPAEPYTDCLTKARLTAVTTMRLYTHGQTSMGYEFSGKELGDKRSRTMDADECLPLAEFLDIHRPVRRCFNLAKKTPQHILRLRKSLRIQRRFAEKKDGERDAAMRDASEQSEDADMVRLPLLFACRGLNSFCRTSTFLSN